MANGHNIIGNNGIGNGVAANPWKNIVTEAGGLGLAEFVSIGVSLGVIAAAPNRDRPGFLHDATKVIGKCLVPYLDSIERGIKFFCKIEDCQPNMNEPREKRAEQYARTLILWGGAAAASFGSKIAVRKLINVVTKTQETVNTGRPIKDFLNNYISPNAHDWSVMKWDEGIHIGSLLFMNTVGAKQTDHMIQGTSNWLQHLGMSKERAKRTAEMGVIWEGSNLLGFAAGVGRIAHYHLSGEATRALKSLNSSTALTGPSYSP